MKTINIERLKLARESRGLTQTSLARVTNLTQAVISRIEKGLANISVEELEEISNVTGYDKNFFYKSHDVYPLKHFYFRKNLGYGTNTKKIESIVNIVSSNIRDLLESIDINVDIPFIDLKKENITPEETAFRIRELFNFPRGPIKNLISTLEKHGIIIHFYNFHKDLKIDGVSFITPEGTPVILVNNERPNSRKIFTIAHEFGHLIMHFKSFIDSEFRDVEDEANRFAAELLLPAREIKGSLFSIDETKLFQLKLNWNTSAQSLLYRANVLGTITKDQYRRWITKFNYFGWRKKEPYEFEIETPKLLNEMFKLHLFNLEYSIEDLTEMFGLNSNDFYEMYVSTIKELENHFPKNFKSKISLKIS